MSRYTRMVRKQAKARAAGKAQNGGNSGGTAVLDRPPSTVGRAGASRDRAESDPAETWLSPKPENHSLSDDVHPSQSAIPQIGRAHV